MASKLVSPPSSLSHSTKLFSFSSDPNSRRAISLPSCHLFPWRSKSSPRLSRRGMEVKCCVKAEKQETSVEGESRAERWGKVSAVLFDMDGVLCNSEEPSRMAAVDVFAELGVEVTVEDFVPFTGTGEANFLGGVASVKGVTGFDTEVAKKRFFEIYLEKYAKPNSGIGFPGALELITQCKSKGLKVAVASSADRIKVDANLAAAALPLSMFDAIVSADAFENLKPAPDIFLAASKILNVPTNECLVIEDALAGVQAANAAGMRCIAVKTTLSEDILKTANPSLIRNYIGDIALDDILSGGSDDYNGKMQGSQVLQASSQNPSDKIIETTNNGPIQSASSDKIGGFMEVGPENIVCSQNIPLIPGSHLCEYIVALLYCVTIQAYIVEKLRLEVVESFIDRFQGSRRDIVRYGSLGIALSCLFFAVSNWKTMQYASPKAIWNMLFGVTQPSFGQNEGNSSSKRIQRMLKYISDLDTSGSAPKVPEFPPKLDWLNSAPLKLSKDLKGKVVVLDFWTYCCINCMHVLPDLEFIEKKYKDMPVAVVGVHSAKFDNEKDLEAIRSAVLRYGITHPVVNDGEMQLWRELGVSSWPTFSVVGPDGKLIAQLAGEGHRKDLDDLVEAALQYYGEKKLLDDTPLPLSLEKDNDPRLVTSPLKFPGKLAIDVLNNRLFISDSNHNRIVVTGLDGNFIVQIGSTGEEGLRDGNFDDATFNRPQGLSYNAKKNILYVADTENHALREIDFVNETVRTLAGNGMKGSDYSGGRKGKTQLLNSPWDVCYEPINEKIYIAMAGQHQIWEHNTLDGTTEVFSGDGYERNLNGSSSTNTSFAQPSGISLSPDLKEAYIADSESSSIRALDLKTGGSRLLAGGDPVFSDNLFKFGDHDGIGSEVLLQHPLGVVCAKNGQIYIADSYNHKIKKLDPVSKRVTTLAGTGKAGFKEGSALTAQLSEPAGIIEAENGRLFIADTNNSVIRYLDLNRKVPELQTLELKGVQPPKKSKSPIRLRRRAPTDAQTIKIDGISSSEGNLSIKISLPEEYHFSKEARSKFSVDSEPDNALTIDPSEGYLSPEGSAVLRFKRSSSMASVGKIYCKVYYCKEDEVCLYQALLFEVPFVEIVSKSQPAEIVLPFLVKPKTPTTTLDLPVSP